MKPFGHLIPGEPLIPVDAYREIVRTEAAAMGIPLRDPSLPRNGAPGWLRRSVIREHDADDWVQAQRVRTRITP